MSAFPHWPLDKVIKNLNNNKDNKNPVVLVTTGALNPVHRGHIAQLHSVAEILRRDHGKTVVGAFVSPSSDVYLRGKFPQGCGDFFLPAHVRHGACAKATEGDSLVAVGGFEVSHTERWPDFPEVCADLQETLNKSVEIQSRSGGGGGGGGTQVKVIYCCGSDHYLKCALWRGVRMSSSLGTAPVACTVRAGDQGRLNDPQYRSDVAYIIPELDGPLAALNSTKIRQALQVLGVAMDASAAQIVMQFFASQQQQQQQG